MSLLPRLCLFLSLLLCAVAVGNAAKPVGAWKPITDLNDPYVTEIAKFAVNEYSKTTNAVGKLTLEKVIKGWTQVVNGTNYRLVLAVKDGHSTADYETVVFVNRREHIRKLVSFSRHPDKKKVVGAWKPIENVNSTRVKKAAEFAVTAHDEKLRAKLKLKLERVLKAEARVMDGVEYRLVLTAKKETAPSSLPAKKYEALVHEKAGGHSMNLIWFRALKA